MQRKHYYVVTGRLPFPDDMLRYDQAQIAGRGTLLGNPAFLVHGLCTVGRWNSFLWSVFEARQYYPAGDSEKGPVLWQVKIQGTWETFHYTAEKLI